MNEESMRLALAEVDRQLASALRSLAEAESGARERGYNSTADRVRAVIDGLAAEAGIASAPERGVESEDGQRGSSREASTTAPRRRGAAGNNRRLP